MRSIIISRTPLRISFVGGGTDYPIWYKSHRGAVLATSIDKYCYIHCRWLPPFFKHKYRVSYSKLEHVNEIKDIQHPSVRETFRYLRIKDGISMQYDSDLPARAGLGTSSSFTVGLLNALYGLKSKMVSKQQLAEEAIHIEQNQIKENVGSQDQITASFGGFNRIEFKVNSFAVHPVLLPHKLLQDYLLLFFTGFSRTASEIAGEQIQKTPERKMELSRLYEMVDEAIHALGHDILEFGNLLHESWMIKRKLTKKITTSEIDKIYQKARDAGAIGGKILGAGGGGFILFFVEPEHQQKVIDKLELLHVPFKFENQGSQIIYYTK